MGSLVFMLICLSSSIKCQMWESHCLLAFNVVSGIRVGPAAPARSPCAGSRAVAAAAAA